MPRDVGLYLEDMLEAAARLQDYTRDLEFEQFVRDPRTIDAVVRNLEILGEASKRVPDTVRDRAAATGRGRFPGHRVNDAMWG